MIGIDIGLAFLGDIIARAAVCGTLTLLGSASAGVNCGMPAPPVETCAAGTVYDPVSMGCGPEIVIPTQ